MDAKIREILDRPFPPEKIKKRRGPRGSKELDYVEGGEVVRRLNEAFDGEWSFHAIERFIQPIRQRDGSERADLVVHGVLEAGGVRHEAFGGAILGHGENAGDDWKIAATDALKKAASYFGVGLHLWIDDDPPVGESVHSSDQGITEKQASAIWAMARKLSWDAEGINRHCLEKYGTGPRQLSKAAASDLIKDLQERLG